MRAAKEIPLPIRDMPENLIVRSGITFPIIWLEIANPPSGSKSSKVIPLWLQPIETWEHHLQGFGKLSRDEEVVMRSICNRRLLNTVLFGKPISEHQTLGGWDGLDSIPSSIGPLKRANMIGLWEHIKSDAWAFGDPAKSDGEVFLIRVNREDLGGFDLMTCFADSYGAAKRFIQQSEPSLKKAFAENKIPWQPFEFPV